MTDVLGGNRNGFHTILVVPVAASDGFLRVSTAKSNAEFSAL